MIIFITQMKTKKKLANSKAIISRSHWPPTGFLTDMAAAGAAAGEKELKKQRAHTG